VGSTAAAAATVKIRIWTVIRIVSTHAVHAIINEDDDKKNLKNKKKRCGLCRGYTSRTHVQAFKKWGDADRS
jgi:hypothetical protein